jgi:hypothetical protein
MRVLHTSPMYVVALCLAAQAFITIHAQQPATPDATAVMAAAREALGSDKRIASVKTIVATGRTRQVQGDNLVPIEFEVNIELPDKYARTDEIPARESGPTTRGSTGADLIQFPEAAPARGAGPAARPPEGSGRDGRAGAPAGAPASAGRAGGPPSDPTTPLKQDFVRLTLGMFATSFSSYPLTFSYGGVAEAPEGKADVIDVKGPANFSARFFVNSQTHLPLMLSWTVPPTLVPVMAGQPPPANLPPGAITFEAPGPAPGPAAGADERQKYQQDLAAARTKAMQQAKPAENRIYYADYRDTDGLKLPFRIRRAVGATTTEETTFDRFKINPKIDPKKFEVRK